jgi:1-acyl-sn-glycerol-3-phosphate acyltransferase
LNKAVSRTFFSDKTTSGKAFSSILATRRAFWLAWHIFMAGILRALSLRLQYGGEWHLTRNGQAAILRWMRRLTKILGLHLHVDQPPTVTPAMLVANHISWLDIIVIATIYPARFLAKDTVRKWPVLGYLAALSGTLFIRRDSSSALRETNATLSENLSAGQSVAVFPEGTTTNGEQVGPFHPALFEAARTAGCPIQPIALRYWRDGNLDTLAPYINDDNFVIHLWRIMGTRETHVQLMFLPTIESGEPRKELMRQSHTTIAQALASAEC